MSPEAMLRTIHIAQLHSQWERAKGELNALTAMLGARPYDHDRDGLSPYEAMGLAVDAFVEAVEGEELHTGGCDW